MQDDRLNAFSEAIHHDQELQERLRLPDADPMSITKEHGFFLGEYSTLLSEANLTEELDDERMERVYSGACLITVSRDSNGIKMAYELKSDNSIRNIGMNY